MTGNSSKNRINFWVKTIGAALGSFLGAAELSASSASAGSTVSETVLYSFCQLANCADGQVPVAGLIIDSKGDLFGTAFRGGGTGNFGVAFRLSPTGRYKVLHAFQYGLFLDRSQCWRRSRSLWVLPCDKDPDAPGNLLQRFLRLALTNGFYDFQDRCEALPPSSIVHPVLILRWLCEAHPREKATDPIFSQKLIVFRRGEILPAGLCSWAKNLKVVRGERRRDGRQDSGNGDFLNHDGIHSKVEALAFLVIGAKTGQAKGHCLPCGQ